MASRFSQAPSLPARLRKRNLRDALVLATDIANAMVFLHGMDIVHGRLTPGAPKSPCRPLAAVVTLRAQSGMFCPLKCAAGMSCL